MDLKQINGNGKKSINALYITEKGNLHIAGSFNNKITTKTNTITSNGRSDAFFGILNSKLEIQKVFHVGGIYDDIGKNILVDNDNNYILTGNFSDTLNIQDTILTSNGNKDIFIIKLDSDLNLNFICSLGGLGNDYANDIDINSKNDIYLTGSYIGNVEKGSWNIASSEYTRDIFLAKFNKTGSLVFLNSFGSQNSDFARNISIDTANYFFLTGNFSKEFIMHNDSVKNNIEDDYFVSRLFDCSELPNVKLLADTTLCANSYIISVDSGYLEYYWNGYKGSNNYQIDTSGYYAIEVIDEKKCRFSDTVLVVLNNPPDINIGDDIVIMPGETIRLNIDNNNVKEYFWSDNSNLNFLDVNTLEMPPGKYLYSVEVKDYNSCSGKDDIMLTNR